MHVIFETTNSSSNNNLNRIIKHHHFGSQHKVGQKKETTKNHSKKRDKERARKAREVYSFKKVTKDVHDGDKLFLTLSNAKWIFVLVCHVVRYFSHCSGLQANLWPWNPFRQKHKFLHLFLCADSRRRRRIRKQKIECAVAA